MDRKKNKKDNIDMSEEAKNNLVGFFKLLLEIDMKNNPGKYQFQHNTINDRRTD